MFFISLDHSSIVSLRDLFGSLRHSRCSSDVFVPDVVFACHYAHPCHCSPMMLQFVFAMADREDEVVLSLMRDRFVVKPPDTVRKDISGSMIVVTSRTTSLWSIENDGESAPGSAKLLSETSAKGSSITDKSPTGTASESGKGKPKELIRSSTEASGSSEKLWTIQSRRQCGMFGFTILKVCYEIFFFSKTAISVCWICIWLSNGTDRIAVFISLSLSFNPYAIKVHVRQL